jgi:hypothetical protein
VAGGSGVATDTDVTGAHGRQRSSTPTRPTTTAAAPARIRFRPGRVGGWRGVRGGTGGSHDNSGGPSGGRDDSQDAGGATCEGSEVVGPSEAASGGTGAPAPPEEVGGSAEVSGGTGACGTGDAWAVPGHGVPAGDVDDTMPTEDADLGDDADS